MYRNTCVVVCALVTIGLAPDLFAAQPNPNSPKGLAKVNHVIIAMQENHSFDNYFGVLALAQGSPYHSPANGTSCAKDPNPTTCVEGLSCTTNPDGTYTCTNSNPDDSGPAVLSFHSNDYCPAPDLDHGWASSHEEGNYEAPNSMLKSSPNEGFVRVNDMTEQLDNGVESPTDDDTMGFYNETDLPFYYSLAETFAIDDHYHCDVVGPTVPNRFYLMAATSFGHLTTSEIVPPAGGYKPITGTIFDKLDAAGITWVDYFSDVPQAGEFRSQDAIHFKPVASFPIDAAAGNLPQVALVDPLLAGETNLATDEHPPHDIRSGEFYMSQIVTAVRNSPNWKDSILFITYDEHGGAYDHAAPPPAVQKGALNPDGINRASARISRTRLPALSPEAAPIARPVRPSTRPSYARRSPSAVRIRRVARTSISSASGCHSSRSRRSPGRITYRTRRAITHRC